MSASKISSIFSFTFLSLASVFAAGTLGAGTVVASAATVDLGTLTWRGYRSNTSPSFVVADDKSYVSISSVDKDSYVWAYLESPISIAVGETMTISGTLTYSSAVSSASGAAFYFGLYDSGNNTADSLTGTISSISDATCSMTGFFAGTVLSKSGEDVSLSSKVYSRFLAKDGETKAGFMTTNQGGSYIASQDLSTAIDLPEQNVEFVFSMTIARSEDGYSISYNGSEAVTFSNAQSLTAESFDVIAFKCIGSAFSLGELSFSVIPEPSLFGLFAGTLAIAFAGTRRRRR